MITFSVDSAAEDCDITAVIIAVTSTDAGTIFFSSRCERAFALDGERSTIWSDLDAGVTSTPFGHRSFYGVRAYECDGGIAIAFDAGQIPAVAAVDGHAAECDAGVVGNADGIVARERAGEHVAVLCGVVGGELREVNTLRHFPAYRVAVAGSVGLGGCQGLVVAFTAAGGGDVDGGI